MLGHSLELKGYAYRIENMPNPVNRGSNKPAQRKGSQVTRRVARKWIGLADAGEWGRAWLPAQAPGQSRTMGGCEQLFSAGVASPLSKTATVFSRTITPLIFHALSHPSRRARSTERKRTKRGRPTLPACSLSLLVTQCRQGCSFSPRPCSRLGRRAGRQVALAAAAAAAAVARHQG